MIYHIPIYSRQTDLSAVLYRIMLRTWRAIKQNKEGKYLSNNHIPKQVQYLSICTWQSKKRAVRGLLW